jgi:hypothetical protein
MMDLWSVPVVVQEKIDGSQFSFGIFDGVLRAKSRNQELVLDHPTTLFAEAVRTALLLARDLHDGWTYRGEYLRVPHHGHLAYGRVPKHHIVLFDINDGEESYIHREMVRVEAERLDLDVVPQLHTGMVTPDIVASLLSARPLLGGDVPIEGVVLKPLVPVYGRDKKLVMAKHVATAYREAQKVTFRAANPQASDVIVDLGKALQTEARWRKAVQHAREDGVLQHAPQDIGPLLKRIEADVKAEEAEAIKNALFSWAWPKLHGKVTLGFPDWYKNELLHRVDGGAA